MLCHYDNSKLIHSCYSVADDIKVLGVILDRRLMFDKHVSAVVRSCS